MKLSMIFFLLKYIVKKTFSLQFRLSHYDTTKKGLVKWEIKYLMVVVTCFAISVGFFVDILFHFDFRKLRPPQGTFGQFGNLCRH